mmetsp:Transcript_109668/g.341801  ORF Transcript_109668/g.341801 Transcript_109668/m.341801 type:complete len:259 (+) Transcript_109668:141-917(+)
MKAGRKAKQTSDRPRQCSRSRRLAARPRPRGRARGADEGSAPAAPCRTRTRRGLRSVVLEPLLGTKPGRRGARRQRVHDEVRDEHPQGRHGLAQGQLCRADVHVGGVGNVQPDQEVQQVREEEDAAPDGENQKAVARRTDHAGASSEVIERQCEQEAAQRYDVDGEEDLPQLPCHHSRPSPQQRESHSAHAARLAECSLSPATAATPTTPQGRNSHGALGGRRANVHGRIAKRDDKDDGLRASGSAMHAVSRPSQTHT